MLCREEALLGQRGQYLLVTGCQITCQQHFPYRAVCDCKLAGIDLIVPQYRFR